MSLIPGSQTVLALWAAQIALNTLWTPVFFGAHQVLAAMVIRTVLWLVVAAMVEVALQLDRITSSVSYTSLNLPTKRLMLSIVAAVTLRHYVRPSTR
ncbi:Tryptophan-rich sensory protein [Pseudomonas fluorescens]|nr:Tryptophan-rich sensory protein [Pseudomonas fluorescens]